MRLHARRFALLLLALASPALTANEGLISFSGAITVPTCPVLVATGDPHASLQAQGVGCEGNGKVAQLKVETIGDPEEGLAEVVVQVY